jgi:hypothetical protein
LKERYCGESPYGNGPDDGCEIVSPKAAQAGVEVIAQWNCDWNAQRSDIVCRQEGKPPASIRTIIAREMHRLGLPTARDAEIKSTVLRSTSAGWSVAAGTYHRLRGETATSCEVVVIVHADLRVNVLRQQRCHEENADVSEGTRWWPLGIADVDGDGNPDIVLEGGEIRESLAGGGQCPRRLGPYDLLRAWLLLVDRCAQNCARDEPATSNFSQRETL